MVRAARRGLRDRRGPGRLHPPRRQDLDGAAACATRCATSRSSLRFRARAAAGGAGEGARARSAGARPPASASSRLAMIPYRAAARAAAARAVAAAARRADRPRARSSTTCASSTSTGAGSPDCDRRGVLPRRRVPARPGRGHHARAPGDPRRARAGPHPHERRLRATTRCRRTSPPMAAPVVIEQGSFVGAAATLLPGVRVGARSFVAAGSVVTADVPAGHARRRRSRARRAHGRLSAPVRSERQRESGGRGGSSALVAFLPFAARRPRRSQPLLPRPLAPLLPAAALRARGPARGRAALLEPLRARGRAALAAPARLSARPAGALAWPHEPLLSLLLALHVPLGALGFFAAGARARAAAGRPPAAARSSTRSAASCCRPSTSTSTSRPPPGRRSWCSDSFASLRMAPARGRSRRRRSPWRCRSRRRASRSSRRRSLAGVWLGLAPRRGRRGRRCAASAALALGAALAAPVLVLVGGPGGGQRARRGLHARRGARPLGPSVRPGADGRGRPLRQPRQPRERVVGPELLPARLPLRAEPLPRSRRRSRSPPPGRFGRARPPDGWLLLARARDPGRARPLGRASARWSSSVAALRVFRFPVKAFFSVHLAVALLAASRSVGALAEGRARADAGGGGASRPACSLARGTPASARPPESARPLRGSRSSRPASPPALRAALLAARARGRGGRRRPRARRRRCSPRLAALGPDRLRRRAAWLVAALVAADLLRAGAGLNPMVPGRFFGPSAELAARLPLLRAGRVFTCPVETSPAYRAGRARARPGPRGLELRACCARR